MYCTKKYFQRFEDLPGLTAKIWSLYNKVSIFYYKLRTRQIFNIMHYEIFSKMQRPSWSNCKALENINNDSIQIN